LFKEVVRLSSENEKNGIQSSLAIIGSKGIGFFNRFNFDIKAQNSGMGDKPSLEEIIGTVKAMLQEYNQDHIDKLYLVFNKFVNTMTQQVKVQQILPLPKTDENTPKGILNSKPIITIVAMHKK
jgi:F-type H+-transporting ATPase subunit gamma